MDQDLFQKLSLLNQVGGLLQRDALINQGAESTRELEKQTKVLEQAARASKELLRKHEAEADRIRSLPKCPECLSSLEWQAKRCPQCREQMFWLPSEFCTDSLEPIAITDLPRSLVEKEQTIFYKYLIAVEHFDLFFDEITNFRKAVAKLGGIRAGSKRLKKIFSLQSAVSYRRNFELKSAESRLQSLTDSLPSVKRNSSFEGLSVLCMFSGIGVVYNSNLRNLIDPMTAISVVFGACLICIGGVSLLCITKEQTLNANNSRSWRKQRRETKDRITELQEQIAEHDTKLSKLRTPAIVALESVYSQLITQISYVNDVNVALASAYRRIVAMANENQVHLEQRQELASLPALAENLPALSGDDYKRVILRFDPLESDLQKMRVSLNLPPRLSYAKQSPNGGNLDYWIKRGERIIGPMPLAKLRQLAIDKKVKSTDEIATSSEGPWLTANDAFRQIKGRQ